MFFQHVCYIFYATSLLIEQLKTSNNACDNLNGAPRKIVCIYPGSVIPKYDILGAPINQAEDLLLECSANQVPHISEAAYGA